MARLSPHTGSTLGARADQKSQKVRSPALGSANENNGGSSDGGSIGILGDSVWVERLGTTGGNYNSDAAFDHLAHHDHDPANYSDYAGTDSHNAQWATCIRWIPKTGEPVSDR